MLGNVGLEVDVPSRLFLFLKWRSRSGFESSRGRVEQWHVNQQRRPVEKKLTTVDQWFVIRGVVHTLLKDTVSSG